MRRILVEHARGRRRERRGGGPGRVELGSPGRGLALDGIDRADLDGALEWRAGRSERQARIVMDVSQTMVECEWRVARARLYRQLRGHGA